MCVHKKIQEVLVKYYPNRIHETFNAYFWCQEVYEICTLNELFIEVFNYLSPNHNTILINQLSVYCSLKKTISTDITFSRNALLEVHFLNFVKTKLWTAFKKKC